MGLKAPGMRPQSTHASTRARLHHPVSITIADAATRGIAKSISQTSTTNAAAAAAPLAAGVATPASILLLTQLV